METKNGLPRHGAVETMGPLAEGTAMVRLALGAFDVTEANEAFLNMVGRELPSIIGSSWSALCAERERDAVLRRLDDVVILGHDTITALAIPHPANGPMWVEVEASYAWRGGERLELALRPIELPSAPPDERWAPLPSTSEGQEEADESADELPVAIEPETGDEDDAQREAEGSPAVAKADSAPDDLDVRGAAPVAAWCDDTAGAVVMEGVTMADAAGVAALALAPGWRVVGATGRAVHLCGARPAEKGPTVGLRLAEVLRMAPDALDILDIARRDGRRQVAHAVARMDGLDVVAEWVPGARPGHGWMLLDELSGEDPTTARLLQAEWHVYQVAHDARNQLAEIDAGLEQLDEALQPAEEGTPGVDLGSESERERLHKTVLLTRAACSAALGIIHDVHEETERAQQAQDPRRVDLGGLVCSTLTTYAPRAAARGVALDEALAFDIWVRAEPARLRRVLTNLFDNALQAMPDGGQLRAASGVDDREQPGVLLTVSDTGRGISPERVERIFQPGETTTPGSKGRGLAIVHRFVLGCGGEIRCDSTLGEGTTFYVWLPRIV